MSAGHVPHTEGQISQNARFQCREFKVRDLTIKAFVRNPDVQMECDREHFDFFWDSDIVGQVIVCDVYSFGVLGPFEGSCPICRFFAPLGALLGFL